jgi:hypothetical protein
MFINHVEYKAIISKLFDVGLNQNWILLVNITVFSENINLMLTKWRSCKIYKLQTRNQDNDKTRFTPFIPHVFAVQSVTLLASN